MVTPRHRRMVGQADSSMDPRAQLVVPDPFGSPVDETDAFEASYDDRCVFGCEIVAGDIVAYQNDGIVCEDHRAR